MKHFYLLITLIIASITAQSQTFQQDISGPHTTSAFNSVKYDANDGGTINAGFVFDSSNTTGRDWYLVKLDKNKNIIWQKTISNPGDDFVTKVIVCNNGDYVAIGVLFQNGIGRGLICRLNSVNGNVIWSFVTNNSLLGEAFSNVVETKAGNIAIAATDQWASSQNNSYIILLDSSGKKKWSQVSQYYLPDAPYCIAQLPNNHLLVGITQWTNGHHYNLYLVELKESNGSLITKQTYSINTQSPNTGVFLNSVSPMEINVMGHQTTIFCQAFAGSGSITSTIIYKYKSNDNSIKGFFYYHPIDVNLSHFTYVPVGTDDYITSETFVNPDRQYISRITNGNVVYSDSVKGSVTSINGIDSTSNGVVLAGSAISKKHNNSYNFFAPRTNPGINTNCKIISANTLIKTPNNLSSSIDDSLIIFGNGGQLLKYKFSFKTSHYKATVICGDSQNNGYSSTIIDNKAAREETLTIFPNPITTTAHFSIPYSSEASVLNIYNALGEKVLTQQLSAGITSTDIDLSMLTHGIYNALLLQGSEKFSSRIIKK